MKGCTNARDILSNTLSGVQAHILQQEVEVHSAYVFPHQLLLLIHFQAARLSRDRDAHYYSSYDLNATISRLRIKEILWKTISFFALVESVHQQTDVLTRR
jgi:hypothetical protein